MIRTLVLTTSVALVAHADNAIQTQFPWSAAIPAEIRAQYIEPLQVFAENPADERARLQKLFLPLVQDCKTPYDVALALAPQMSKVTGVIYSTARSKAVMNATESLNEKKASCSGLSILFASTLRALGVPARVVGVATWNHVRGNHTWTEFWHNGEWHMLEFNEKAPNTPWVMEAVGMLDFRSKYQRVMAITGKAVTGEDDYFILPWMPAKKNLGAEDVSARYMKLAKDWYAKDQKPEHAHTQRLMVDVFPRVPEPPTVALVDDKGKVLGEGKLPSPTDDMRKMLRLNLPMDNERQYFLRFPDGQQMPVKATNTPVQILRLKTSAA